MTILWKPSLTAINNSQMQQFMQYVHDRYKQTFNEYADLYHWSIECPEQFWAMVWDFCQVICSRRWDIILKDPQKMPGAKWFIGAKLNFAENILMPMLLKQGHEKVALIFRNEIGEHRVLTYAQLYQAVEKLASAFRALGIKAKDRVVGLIPNIPETVIAMLASTSIGAIWSSCSPDFGEQGALDRFSQIEPTCLITTDGYYYNGKSFSLLSKIQCLVSAISSLKKVLIVGYLQPNPDIASIPTAILYEDFIQSNRITPLSFEQLPFDHPIYILYSSGTTGKPKCIVHSAGGVLLQLLKEHRLHTDLKDQDTLFYFTTCGWMMWNWQVNALALGTTLVLYDGAAFYPRKSILLDILAQEKVTVWGTSAKFLSSAEKLALQPIMSHQLETLRTILSTGSPLLPMNFTYVYTKIKADICLSSISGGTDIASCFALGNPILPVYSGELQCRALGLKVEIYNEDGQAVIAEKGELVCTKPFPAMPIYFWNDKQAIQYQSAYFEKYPNVWAQGDYAELTPNNGIIIYGRSDTVLNPGGIRIGTAEIYRQVEVLTEVAESLVIGQNWAGDIRVILFVILTPGLSLTAELKKKIKHILRYQASPHHVPAKIIQVTDIPRTLSGKIAELAVRELIHGRPINNKAVLANPEALAYFESLTELQK